MNYHGKLYGKLGRQYFDTSHTTDEWDAMEKQIAELKAENEALKEELQNNAPDKRRRIAIIDHFDHKTQIAEALIHAFEEKTGEKVELVHVNDNQPDFLVQKSDPLLFQIRDIPDLIELPFYPKAKHSPKGHERKYKYHR